MKSQQITDDIRKAIWDWYKAEKLTQIQMAQLLGINQASLNSWMNGNAKNIRPHNWGKLYPHIKKYFPPNITMGDSSPIVTGSHAVGINNGTITQSCLDSVMDKILSSKELSAEVKVKVLKVLKK